MRRVDAFNNLHCQDSEPNSPQQRLPTPVGGKTRISTTPAPPWIGGTFWTDASRLDNGRAGVAFAWRAHEGWVGRRFHLGNNKEVFDAKVFAIYQALRIFDARQETGQTHTVFSDSQPAIR